MLNYIWFGMLVAGFLTGMMNGRIEEITKAAMDSAVDAVKLSINLLGVLCLWTGLMKIAEKSGLVQIIARAVRPFIRLAFPEVPGNHPAIGAIVLNLVANFLGLGNAATPLGLKAMSELQRLNSHKDTATDAMIMFLVLNTAAIQLVPATVIAIRSAEGSAGPAEIIAPIWISSTIATATGIMAAKLFSAGSRHGGKR